MVQQLRDSSPLQSAQWFGMTQLRVFVPLNEIASGLEEDRALAMAEYINGSSS
jgi:hypothetical protein